MRHAIIIGLLCLLAGCAIPDSVRREGERFVENLGRSQEQIVSRVVDEVREVVRNPTREQAAESGTEILLYVLLTGLGVAGAGAGAARLGSGRRKE